MVLDAAEVQQHFDGLGPDPMVDKGKKAEQRFVDNVRKRAVPIGLLPDGPGRPPRGSATCTAPNSCTVRGSTSHIRGNRLIEEQIRGLWRD